MKNDNLILDDFQLIEKPSNELIEKYKNLLPESVLQIWQQYGFGSFINGYFRVVNPDDYKNLLKESWSEYEDRFEVLFTTAMGDLLVKKDDFLYFLDFRHGNTEVVAKDYDLFFFRCLPDSEYLEDELSWEPYEKAVEKFGVPAFDECFGYEPVLAAGGNEKVENLKKVKIREHINIITQFSGKI